MSNHAISFRSRLRRASSRRRVLAIGHAFSSISRLIINTRHGTSDRPRPRFWRQKNGKRRKNVEADRLSSLPDELIHKVLSFTGIKHIVEMSVLSSRWRYIWTSMPYLNFSSKDFSTLPEFSKFVKHVLSGRNNQVEVCSVNLTFRGKVSQVFVKKLMNYAFSHNVQQLTVTFLVVKDVELPSSLFSCQTLKQLRLTKKHYGSRLRSCVISPISTWELPALTTLHLDEFTLYDDNTDTCIALISKCPNLENLTLQCCEMNGVNGFNICHSRLSNLTLETTQCYAKFVNVVAPQLKNLSIRRSSGKILISAPDLAYLLLENYDDLNFSADGFRSLEKLNLCILHPYSKDKAHKIVALLQHFHSVKCLTLNLEIVECLSSSMELISHQPCPFANLNSLRIYPKSFVHVDLRKERSTLSNEVKRYLLDGSPGATFTMVTRKEIMAEQNATEAQNCMDELRVHLEKEKANIETNMAHMHEEGKPQPETKMQLQTGESMVQMKNCWENLNVQIWQMKAEACLIISKLKDIEELLTVLPSSKRAMIQPCFSSLCAEADIVMKKMTDSMKIECDENQSRLSLYFHGLLTSFDPLFSR